MTYKSLSPRLVQSIYIYISELVNKSTYFNREGGCGGTRWGEAINHDPQILQNRVSSC